MNLWCLHGNLQLPSVWDKFKGKWQTTDAGLATPVKLRCPNLWKNPATDFEAWTQGFCRQIAATHAGPNWLMGYSLGGRLALHAVLEQPDLWQGIVVIGAHPGYASEVEREKQRAWDDAWAIRFKNQSNLWDELLQTWDALPIFNGRPTVTHRPESAFSRARIALCFQNFSKGRQQFLTPRLSNLTAPPILFLSGDQDNRYSEIGRQMALACQVVQHRTIPNAGHRAPWENPEAFIREIQVFLEATS